MENVFQSSLIKKPGRSWFDLSHHHKTTLNMGELVPINCIEVLPGDKFEFSSEILARMQPMVAPVMHKVDLYVHHFFVPFRILWSNWEKFMSPPNLSSTTLPPVHPTFDTSLLNVRVGDLLNYLGIPAADYSSDLGTDAQWSVLYAAAYQRIFFDYYRDQNLQLESFDDFDAWIRIVDGVQDSGVTAKLMQLQIRAWEHDYWTSQLPFAQKSGEAVALPIQVEVPIDIDVTLHPDSPTTHTVKTATGAAYGVSGAAQVDGGFEGPDGTPLIIDPEGLWKVQDTVTSSQVLTTINDLRVAWALQRWLEKQARGGSRYQESILINFGVKGSDARLQRPEYLGGSRSTMNISEVLQTSSTDGTSPQGNMAGHGISAMSGNQVSYFAEEHGTIISILSVRPKSEYYQGLPRKFSKLTRLDYYFPDFALLGEEAIPNKEVYLQNTAGGGTNDDTFGYLPRYSDLRYLPSRVSGDFQDLMKTWSLHREFNSPPALNSTFIECVPSSRIFAVAPAPDVPKYIIAHVYNKIMANRTLPRYGVPAL